ncbi:tyrosine-type recombinase/integrase [Haloferax sp. MBLA0076]|uniref:Tyrosine-type recombinase/integrase n=1 Tax=Haloferax litoreum TaxID=2666140 RepID=A0A6A8GD54_9EURY|nr:MULTISPECIES: tyrosine-type recombinase/integrase [Haloferax]KAB1192031.1 tyrosine-type recombinase/integrase [Haloferax sp. CBA1148]MRX20472.1 tyrosine-type recombinase/integrase [Haloferax litoreum]
MPTDPKQSVDTLRRKLRNDKRGGCTHDRELLLDFSDELRLLREDYGHYRHEKLLRHCVRISEHADACLHETLVTEREGDVEDDETFYEAKDAAKTVTRWIHDTYDIEDGSQETNRDYRVAFRLFAKHVTRGDEIPETHKWISTKTSRNYQPEPDEADMLDLEDDVKPMIDAARNPRDKALIALQFEGGFRGGELYDMRVKDVTDGEHSLKVRVDGKRGEHDVHLIMAVPYVKRWLSEHPGGRDDYLWTKLNDPTRFSYTRFLQCFKASGERAGVTKPVTPTNFRKSNAYWLSTREKSQAFIEDRQGRARGSPVISRYVAKFSGETQELQYAAMHGLDIGEEETKEVAPVTCPRCEKKTPRERDFCIHCNQALDLEAKQLIDRVGQALDDKVVETDDPEVRRDLLRARRTLSEKPAVMDADELHELASSLSVSDED